MLAALVAALSTREVHATPPFAAAARVLPASLQRAVFGGARTPALVVRPGGAVTITSVPLSTLDALRNERGEWSVGALRRPLLDQSVAAIGATNLRLGPRGLTGRGVSVGVVDTGLDVRHADLRRADGSSRVAWYLDLSQPARGVHADLESRFGIDGDGMRFGAVWSGDEITALLMREDASHARGDELPVDEVGHGTYVTSIAAGNGLATGNGLAGGRYVGVAPEATVIAVRASAAGSDRFTDAAIVQGVGFAFDRATALGQPCVVNLSVGSHHGTHDGSSPLERALAGFVAGEPVGRAIVVAAGNDGTDAIHARVDLLPRSETSFVLDLADATDAQDTVDVEIAYEAVTSLAVRFPTSGATAMVTPGLARGFASGDGFASVSNATDEDPEAMAASLAPDLRPHQASVLLSGDPDRHVVRHGGRWQIVLSGAGPVHAWIADRGLARPQAVFATRALDYGTVTVPATSDALVSVGALVTRRSWPTLHGATIDCDPCDGLIVGAVAGFSARGPNRVGALVPDVLAPGAFVLAALGADATPEGPRSIFAGHPELVAADGVHAASAGTSAAAPHVAGAMALLLEAHPDATQDEMRDALEGSARAVTSGASARWNPGEGYGGIAVDRALARLEATRAGASGALVDLARCELTVAQPTVAPDEPTTVSVRVLDASGEVVTGSHAVTVTSDRGTVEATVSAGAGLWQARWRATDMAPGDHAVLHASVDGQPIDATARVDVWADVANGNAGLLAHGGCRAGGGDAAGSATMAALALSVAWRRRRARRAAGRTRCDRAGRATRGDCRRNR